MLGLSTLFRYKKLRKTLYVSLASPNQQIRKLQITHLQFFKNDLLAHTLVKECGIRPAA